MRNLNQKGLTFFGMVVAALIVIFIIFFIMKLFPVFAEYRTISRVVAYAAVGTSESEVKRRYDDQIWREGVSNPLVTGNDLKVKVVGNTTTVSYLFESEVPLIGENILLVIRFNDEQKSTNH